MNDDGFDLLYPDVLGAITGGSRFTIGDLQVAVGIFPDRTYINQPIEVIVILQNMIDSNLQVRVGVGFPAEDKKGRPVVIDTPQKITDITVGPGEVGTLRIPIIPLPPTQSGMHFPVRVAIRYRPSVKNPQTVRPPAGGAPPTVLSVSPFKLQALQEVTFNASLWQESTDVITVHFDIAPRRVALPQQNFATRYEILWTHAGMEEQRTLAREQVNDAHYVASNFTVSNVFIPLLAAVSERFAERNLVLHPGEAAAITKIIAYVQSLPHRANAHCRRCPPDRRIDRPGHPQFADHPVLSRTGAGDDRAHRLERQLVHFCHLGLQTGRANHS